MLEEVIPGIKYASICRKKNGEYIEIHTSTYMGDIRLLQRARRHTIWKKQQQERECKKRMQTDYSNCIYNTRQTKK